MLLAKLLVAVAVCGLAAFVLNACGVPLLPLPWLFVLVLLCLLVR
jgi:hypothetical protein